MQKAPAVNTKPMGDDHVTITALTIDYLILKWFKHTPTQNQKHSCWKMKIHQKGDINYSEGFLSLKLFQTLQYSAPPPPPQQQSS